MIRHSSGLTSLLCPPMLVCVVLSVLCRAWLVKVGDAPHQSVVYRQSCNEIAAFVQDLPQVLAHVV